MKFRYILIVVLVMTMLLSGCITYDEPSEETETETEPDGAETETEPDGSEDETEPDGSETETESDGAETETESDGAETETEPDGSETETESDGAETETEPDGSDVSTGSERNDVIQTETLVRENEANAQGWAPPEPPNKPMEDKRNERGVGHIHNVEFVDASPADGSNGYADFNLEVTADTRMENVDPPEHGSVEGEPFFFVKINEGEGNRLEIERTDIVPMEENGVFHIPVRAEGLEPFEPGPTTVEVFLVDRDKDWDDIYASWEGTINYNPNAA